MAAARIMGQDSVALDLIPEYNARPELLTAMIKQRDLVKGHLGYLHLAQIDVKNSRLLILYHPPPSHDEKELWVNIEPKAADSTEIKSRLKVWRAEAKKHFDIPDAPTIDYYSPPAPFPFTIPIILALCVLFFALLGRGHYADLFRAKIAEKGGRGLLPGAAGFCAFMHLFSEPLYMIILARRHRVPLLPALKWVFTVVCLGYAGLNEWSECVEYEQLRHIYKRTDVGDLPPRISGPGAGSKTKAE